MVFLTLVQLYHVLDAIFIYFWVYVCLILKTYLRMTI